MLIDNRDDPSKRILTIVGFLNDTSRGFRVVSTESKMVENIDEGLAFGRLLSEEFTARVKTVCLEGNVVLAREIYGEMGWTEEGWTSPSERYYKPGLQKSEPI
jgi:hypothetical protein